jgi:hypothetical protein
VPPVSRGDSCNFIGGLGSIAVQRRPKVLAARILCGALNVSLEATSFLKKTVQNIYNQYVS